MTSNWPDRVKLAVSFDPLRLEASLAALEGVEWTDHFVTRNYQGRWAVMALRAPAGSERQHPILQVVSHPGVTAFADTAVLARAPYLRDVLRGLGFPLGPARLMWLDPGSVILPHRDADLDAARGWARLHVPIRTNAGVEFLLNDRRVDMKPGECWYLRLSDAHSVRNGGSTPRVHLVIDAPASLEFTAAVETSLQSAANASRNDA